MPRNPFTPTFGVVPPHLAGRELLLADMRQAFEDGLGSPDLATLIVGARGSGKTALLATIARLAETSGWIAANTVSAEGMLEDIIQCAGKSAAHLVEHSGRRHVSGLNVGQILGIEWETDPAQRLNWRNRMADLLDKLAEAETGLLITVDEVQTDVPELFQLVSTYQLFVREGRQVALVMAGLPGNVSQLLNDKSVSFLRRSSQRHLGRIDDQDIAGAFERTVLDAGKRIDEDALAMAVESISGFPYMMQLVGYRTWSQTGDEDQIRVNHVRRGVELAQRGMREGVLATTYKGLSAGDRRFLQAMLEDDGASSLSDIAFRLGKSTGYASTYKTRLTEQGIIDEDLTGRLRIDMPFMREYLHELPRV